MDLQELRETQLDAFRAKYEALALDARRTIGTGGADTGIPDA